MMFCVLYPIIATILLVFTPNPLNVPNTLPPDDAAGYADAPACRFDIDRHFSVDAAIQALDRARAAQTRNEISNELKNAALHLEQVMNYGALKWADCLTCNPYSSIDWDPQHSYMVVAQRLIAMSREFYNDPNYNGYSGLYETMENRYQRDPYCGDKATAMSIDAVKGDYEFGRETPAHQPLCGGSVAGTKFTLTDQATPIGWGLVSCHPNERAYWYFNGEVIFIAADGYVSSILYSGGGTNYFEGPYVVDKSAGITHYIERGGKKKNPCAEPSWGSGAPAAQVRLGEPPYGESHWAPDGDKYWIVSPSYATQYFTVSGGRLERYDKCHNRIASHVVDKRESQPDGKSVWSGHTLDANGQDQGRGWYAVWDY